MSEPADLDLRPARPGFLQRLSVVWLVPVIALAVSLGVAWKNWSDRGTLIHIAFGNASGVTAGETQLKYRDVAVGVVERVGFSEDLAQVIVSVRVDKDVAPFLDDQATFWVVRPQVSVRGISGLDTVLSGVFIEGSWDSVITGTQTEFAGQDEPPLVRPGQDGIRVTFRMRDGNQLTAGAPILHKGIEVGQVETPRLSPQGDSVLVDAFIRAPYDQRVTTATRFWDTSGFSVGLGTNGVTLNVNSLASLIEGGISFDTLVSGGRPIEPGHQFDIFDDETTARQSVFEDPAAEELMLSILFDGSISGLTEGADVRYRGIKVGEVRDIGAVIVDRNGGRDVRLLANVAIRTGRLGLAEGEAATAGMDLMEGYVANGMRARLANASLLSAALIIELVELPDAPPATIDLAAEPYPVLPSVPAELSDFSATAEGVFQRINALPVEELMDRAISLLESLDSLANDPALRQTPESALALLEETRAIVSSEDLVQLPADLRAAANDLRQMMTDLQDGEAVANLLAAIEKADAALASIETASADLPEITAQLKALGEKANSLAVEELVSSTTKLVESADAFIGTEEARKLPPALTAALDEITVFLGQVREGGAIENANQAISAAEAAANAVAQAADSLPDLTARLNRLVDQTSGVVGSYGDRSRFNGELMSTLRDIQKSAEAITALARQISRNPNSLILGR